MLTPSLAIILAQGFIKVSEGQFQHKEYNIRLKIQSMDIQVICKGATLSTNSMSDDFFNDYMKIALDCVKPKNYYPMGFVIKGRGVDKNSQL